MPRRRLKRPFALPSAGGVLSIINCLFWLLLLTHTDHQSGLPEVLLITPAFLFAIPILWLVPLVPNLGQSHLTDLILVGMAMGANSFLWGYGLAAIARKLVNRRRTKKEFEMACRWQCATCGYDLRATPDRCPECGTIPKFKFAGAGESNWPTIEP